MSDATWEKVTECTWRLRVCSGWLYRYGSSYGYDHHIVFVPLSC